MILEDKSILRFVLLPIPPLEIAVTDVDRPCKGLMFLAVQSFTKDYSRRFMKKLMSWLLRRIKPWIECALCLNSISVP